LGLNPLRLEETWMVKKTDAPAKPVARKRVATPAARKVAPAAKTARSQRAAGATGPAVPKADRLVETAARNTLAVNPLIGIRAADFGGAAQALLGAAVKQPVKAARHLGAYAKELSRAALGQSELQADPRDKRFSDPAWQSSALLKRLVQAHAATGKELGRYIDATSLNARDKARAHLVASIFVDTIAPSNTLLNPKASRTWPTTCATTRVCRRRSTSRASRSAATCACRPATWCSATRRSNSSSTSRRSTRSTRGRS
jgi:polyhydroxyalkanoate synthase subunit PhaC